MNSNKNESSEKTGEISTDRSKESTEEVCETDSIATDRSYDSENTSVNDLSNISENSSQFDQNESSTSFEISGKSQSGSESKETSEFEENKLQQYHISEAPEVKLHRSQRQARIFIKNDEKDAAITEYIKCLALARIIYGDQHWCLAQAHMILADSYLDLKNYVRQALDHAEKAKRILLLWKQLPRTLKKRIKFLYVLVNTYCIVGKTQTALCRFSIAERHLEKAKKLSLIYSKSVEDDRKANVLKCKVHTATAKLLFDEEMFSKAIEEYKEVINLMEETGGGNAKAQISVYLYLGRCYQKMKEFPNAEEQFNNAINISEKSFGNWSEAAVESKLLLAQNYSLIKTIPATDAAEDILRNVIHNTSSEEFYSHLNFQAIDLLFSIFISSDREQEAKELLESNLPKKCKVFGQASNEVILTLRLLGSLCLTLDEPQTAAKYLKKCYDRELILYGSNHSRVKNTKRALELVCQNTSVPRKYHVQSPLSIIQSRPRFVLS